MQIRKIKLMQLDCDIKVRLAMKRPCKISEFALKVFQSMIWVAVFTSVAMIGATGEICVASDPDRQEVVLNVSEPDPLSDAQASNAVAHGAPEKDADQFFRSYMLPGAALLIMIISITLVAIFFPRRKTE
ncbi:MAG: hypothetical protein WBR24_23740 [Desulfobacterales bacterium]|jgi:hypothetical protein